MTTSPDHVATDSPRTSEPAFLVYTNFMPENFGGDSSSWAQNNIFPAGTTLYHPWIGYSHVSLESDSIEPGVHPGHVLDSWDQIPSLSRTFLFERGYSREMFNESHLLERPTSRDNLFRDALFAVARSNLVITEGNFLNRGDEAIVIAFANHMGGVETLLVVDGTNSPVFLGHLSSSIIPTSGVPSHVRAAKLTFDLQQRLKATEAQLASVQATVTTEARHVGGPPTKPRSHKKA